MQIYCRMWNTHLELGTIPKLFQHGKGKAGQSLLRSSFFPRTDEGHWTGHPIFPAQTLDGATSMKYLCPSPTSAPPCPLQLWSHSHGAALSAQSHLDASFTSKARRQVHISPTKMEGVLLHCLQTVLGQSFGTFLGTFCSTTAPTVSELAISWHISICSRIFPISPFSVTQQCTLKPRNATPL